MGDRVGVESLFNSVEFGSQSSCLQTSRQWRPDVVGKTTPNRGGPRKSPDRIDPNIRRTKKTQRDGHNSGVKIWSSCLVSSTLSHANLEQPFRTLAIKWEVNVFKEVLLALCCCELFYIYMCMYVDVNLHMWLYNIVRFGACASRVLQGFKTNLVTVNDSFKHPNTTSTRGTKKNAGIERSKQKKQEQTGNYNRNEPAQKERKENKKTMQRAGR